MRQGSRSSLFRAKAIEYHNKSLEGDILVSPTISHSLLTFLFICWFTGCLFFLVSNEFARKETVKGWLEPSKGILKVYSEIPNGIVEKVFITEGQYVQAGEHLFVIGCVFR